MGIEEDIGRRWEEGMMWTSVSVQAESGRGQEGQRDEVRG
jgi:hypothetical protein